MSVDKSPTEQSAINLERQRCAYIIQALHDQFAQIATDFDGYQPKWPILLEDLRGAIRKIESGEPPNPYWKPVSEIGGIDLSSIALQSIDRVSAAEGRAEIEDGNIVIRVAIECLPAIVNGGPHSDTIEITNAEEFARDLLRELQSESEDGTTIVHRMFDDAILGAYENGAEGCRQYNPVISELESEFDDEFN